jgi:hypothetical protein
MQQGQRTYAPASLLVRDRIGNLSKAEARGSGASGFRKLEDRQMAPLAYSGCKNPDPMPSRSILLRMLDTFAEWQMRHSHSVISRGHADSATISGVTQPSSTNERSSISPCDR